MLTSRAHFECPHIGRSGKRHARTGGGTTHLRARGSRQTPASVVPSISSRRDDRAVVMLTLGPFVGSATAERSHIDEVSLFKGFDPI
jgi:hypothetical protein